MIRKDEEYREPIAEGREIYIIEHVVQKVSTRITGYAVFRGETVAAVNTKGV